MQAILRDQLSGAASNAAWQHILRCPGWEQLHALAGAAFIATLLSTHTVLCCIGQAVLQISGCPLSVVARAQMHAAKHAGHLSVQHSSKQSAWHQSKRTARPEADNHGANGIDSTAAPRAAQAAPAHQRQQGQGQSRLSAHKLSGQSRADAAVGKKRCRPPSWQRKRRKRQAVAQQGLSSDTHAINHNCSIAEQTRAVATCAGHQIANRPAVMAGKRVRCDITPDSLLAANPICKQPRSAITVAAAAQHNLHSSNAAQVPCRGTGVGMKALHPGSEAFSLQSALFQAQWHARGGLPRCNPLSHLWTQSVSQCLADTGLMRHHAIKQESQASCSMALLHDAVPKVTRLEAGVDAPSKSQPNSQTQARQSTKQATERSSARSEAARQLARAIWGRAAPLRGAARSHAHQASSAVRLHPAQHAAVLPVLADLLARAQRVPYVAILQATCPMWREEDGRKRNASVQSAKPLRCGAVLQHALPPQRVCAFVRAVLHRLLPPGLLAGAFKPLLAHVATLLALRRHEQLSVHDLMQRLPTQRIPWLQALCAF